MKSMIYLILIAFFTFSCQNSESKSTTIDSETRLSQFERAGYSDLLIDKAGIYHAVFLESPAIGKPVFVYYCFSSNQGKSWSKPVTISNDGTGNGSSYPRIIQDGRGTIYAIWKRYGNSKSAYAIGETILEGTGGYNIGTIYFSTLNAGSFSKPTMLADNEAMQISWFPALDNAGNLHVLWSQISSESHKNSWNSWNFADYLRDAKISGNTILGITDYTTPSPPSYPGGAPPYNGWQNLRGYCDKSGKFRFIGEVLVDKVKTIMYFDGTKTSAVHQYPLYKEGNTFNNPAALLTDELGNDHVVFKPSSATLESEQIWDLNLSTNKTNVIASIQKKGVTIHGFQAVQGPNGEMAATIQAGGYSNTNESYGLFYKNGKWTTQALTNNGTKETFTYTEFKSYIGRNTYLSTLTKYNTNFISVAWNASGKKSMLITLAANWSGLGFSTSSPSVVFTAID
jgi:hypothetical protein